MKLGFLTATALLITTAFAAFAAPAKAQQVCIVDNNNNVICGRPATDRDLNRYNNSQYDTPRQERRDNVKNINDIYLDVLGRDGTRNEVRTWSRDLERGRSLDDVRRELAQSPEARQKINQIYRE